MDGLVIVNGVNDASLGLKRMEFAFIKQGDKMIKDLFTLILLMAMVLVIAFI